MHYFLEDSLMRKKLTIILFILVALSLVACDMDTTGNKTNENNNTVTDNKPDDDENNPEYPDEPVQEMSQEINEEIVNNDELQATLLRIERKEDVFFEEVYNVIFEVENKLDHQIAVQARQVSADGEEIDETILSMSQNVDPGKKEKAVLQVLNMDGYEFPNIEENFEMILHVISFENFNYMEEYPVKVQLN